MALHLLAVEQSMRNYLMHTGTHTHIWKICRQLWEITRKSWTGMRWDLLFGWSPAELLCGLSCSHVATAICTWPLLEKKANITHLCPLSPLFHTLHSVHLALGTALCRSEWSMLSWSFTPMQSALWGPNFSQRGLTLKYLFFVKSQRILEKLLFTKLFLSELWS